MRKISTFLYVAMLAMISVSFVSCDEDEEIAFILDGTWEGRTEGRYQDYTTTIRFFQSGCSTSGTGYEWDTQHYYHSTDYCGFDWYVSNRNIYLRYDDGADIVIYDYDLSSNCFSGYLTDRRSGRDRAYFSWRKMRGNSHDAGWRYYAPKKKEVSE